MSHIAIEYPGMLRSKVDAFAFSLPGWYGSGSTLTGDRVRDHAIDADDLKDPKGMTDAIRKVLTMFGDDIEVTYVGA